MSAPFVKGEAVFFFSHVALLKILLQRVTLLEL